MGYDQINVPSGERYLAVTCVCRRHVILTPSKHPYAFVGGEFDLAHRKRLRCLYCGRRGQVEIRIGWDAGKSRT